MAFDLGRNLGCALFVSDRLHSFQRVRLASKGSALWPEMEHAAGTWLRQGGSLGDPTMAYELLTFGQRGYQAAHMYGGLKAMVELVAHHQGVPSVPIPVSTWKKAIGARGPGKPAFIAAVNQRFGLTLAPKDEDIAAAIGVGWAHVVRSVRNS